MATERHLVWVCTGCDECAPQDGSERSVLPCDGPSMDGAWVVRADDYDRLRDALRRIVELDADVDLWDRDPPESIPLDAMVSGLDVLMRAKTIARRALGGEHGD